MLVVQSELDGPEYNIEALNDDVVVGIYFGDLIGLDSNPCSPELWGTREPAKKGLEHLDLLPGIGESVKIEPAGDGVAGLIGIGKAEGVFDELIVEEEVGVLYLLPGKPLSDVDVLGEHDAKLDLVLCDQVEEGVHEDEVPVKVLGSDFVPLDLGEQSKSSLAVEQELLNLGDVL